MNNITNATEQVETSWVIVPIVLSVLIYMSLTLYMWPYARPIFSLWILLFCILFPPAFLLISTYILVQFCFGTLVAVRPAIVVVDAPVPVVGRNGRVRPAFTTNRGLRV